MGKRLNQKETLEELRSLMEANHTNYKALELDKLSEEQFNWKKDEKSWSVAQTLDHIVMSNEHYFGNFRSIIKKEADNAIPDTFKQGMIGGWLANAMPKVNGNEITNKVKTFKPVDPLRNGKSPMKYEGSLLQKFEANLAELQTYVDQADRYDLNQHKTNSLIGGIIKIKLGDALLLLTRHVDRHYAQVRNVMEQPGFPS